MKTKVMTIVGTRPEIIKLSRVIAELEKHTEHILVHTGQNYDYELNEIFFKDLKEINSKNSFVFNSVPSIDSKENNIYVGSENDMAIKKFNISELIWLDKKKNTKKTVKEIDVQLSSEHVTQKANISLTNSDQALISLKARKINLHLKT